VVDTDEHFLGKYIKVQILTNNVPIVTASLLQTLMAKTAMTTMKSAHSSAIEVCKEDDI
jgi:hypothetical protein